MNTDSSVNVVVFEVLIDLRLENLLGESPTRALDGVRRAWEELAAAFGIRPTDVRRVYSQWEPTADDRAFIAAEFAPAVTISFSFNRPLPQRAWGNGTPDFVRAVEDFERERFDTKGTRPARPWWQYWG